MPSKRPALVDEYFRIISEMRKLNFAPNQQPHKALGGLTHTQFGMMMFIQYHGLNTINALANYMGVSASAATQLTNGLVELKLITRKTDNVDRRKTILALSKKGLALSKKMKQHMRNRFADLLEPLTDAELTQLVALQQKVLTYAKRTKTK